MVTLLRPHRHAHGPAAVSVRRLSTRHSQHQLPPPPPLPGPGSVVVVLRPMAQDPSHPHRQSKDDTAAPPQQPEIPRDVREAAASTSASSGGSDAGSSWLQLGIGGPSSASPPPSPPHRLKRPRPDDDAGPSVSVSVQPAAAPLLPPPQLQLQLSLQPGPSSSSSAAPVGAVVAAAPPPPAHEAGLWFLLRAAQNQRREPPLLQIPRSFLRVREGRMTVRVVMRYLVNKLGLDDDSQLEITCRGQHLQPTMTLQQVRDTIWRPVPAEAAAVLPAPGSPSTSQVMTLHYGRC
ncbi:protein LAX PANICLE 2 [Zea mays]|uniref:protein LAX PANICLE 2 n=1 Tax=Zea mays TaxID=4577 RepID=UPI0009AAA055|nr:protein LAX PANICLE 2 [Zea mays]|eukprot:XP_008674197.2 protein LAX PANICLE 2 [Zea mays]